MKSLLTATVAVCLLAGYCTGQVKGQELKTQKEKASYAIGLNIGESLKSDGMDVDGALIGRGIADVLGGRQPALSPEEVQTVLMAFQQEMAQRREAQAGSAGDKNKREGEAFLAANKQKPGVVTLPSGLQYKILRPGTGPKPTPANTVRTHYRGTLLDGTEFDSSYRRGEPAEFPVGGVIAGWTEALQLMKVGAKWQLFIPSNLAYGQRGAAGGDIGPNAALVFEIELLGIVNPAGGRP